MLIAFKIIFIFLTFLNSVAHLFGFLLLKELYRNGKDTPQLLYIMNLSICQTIKNLVLFLTMFLHMMTKYGLPSPHVNSVIVEVQRHLVLFGTMVFFLFYVLMIFVTVDRLLEVYLSLKYPVFVNIAIATRQLKTTWILCVLISIYLSVCYELHGSHSISVFDLYICLILDLLYLIIAVVTYTYLFTRFKNTRGGSGSRSANHNLAAQHRHVSAFNVFRHSRFYVSVLIVTSFLVLFVIPDLVATCMNFRKNRSEFLLIVLFICNGVSDFCNAVVYIFIQRPVKRLLLKKCKALLDDYYKKDMTSSHLVKQSRDVQETRL